MRVPRHDRYVPREPWRLFRDLKARPSATDTGRISRSELTRVRHELARTRQSGERRRRARPV
jgi:hypothetical protein